MRMHLLVFRGVSRYSCDSYPRLHLMAAEQFYFGFRFHRETGGGGGSVSRRVSARVRGRAYHALFYVLVLWNSCREEYPPVVS